jgi:hypothetical protein
MNYKYDNNIDVFAVLRIISLLVVVAMLAAQCHRSISKGTDFKTEIATVIDKDIKHSRNTTDKYLVFCKDKNGSPVVYEITDSLVAGRFNSSDVYASIEIGKTYEFTVAGDRNELMSWYPNIYELKEIVNEYQS